MWMDGTMFMHQPRTKAIIEAVREMGGAKHVISQFTLPKAESEFLEGDIRMW